MPQNLEKAALDKQSAMEARGLEHLVIFATSTLQPKVAAKVAIALTTVLHKTHLGLYPFLQMWIEPLLSTQILTTFPLKTSMPAESESKGPTSSQASAGSIIGGTTSVDSFPPGDVSPPTWQHSPDPPTLV